MKYFFSVEKDRAVELKVKRSTFIGHLRYVKTFDEAKSYISEISKIHKTANHNCWAYILGDSGQTFHSSDAGEPSGTAGKPMLNMLHKNNMTNVVAVVTRYFGGVKLGIRGLIEAYGESINAVISESSLKKLVSYKEYELSCGYDFAETLKYRIINMNAEILNTEYTENIKMKIRIEDHEKSELELYLNEMVDSGKIYLYLICAIVSPVV